MNLFVPDSEEVIKTGNFQVDTNNNNKGLFKVDITPFDDYHFFVLLLLTSFSIISRGDRVCIPNTKEGC